MKTSDIRKKHCPSCVDDFYNGNNQFGIEECIHLKSARLVTGKVIGINERPPYTHIHKEKKPNCWRKKGVIFLQESSRG